uniref:PCNA-interacting partner-like n=1 Tax=Myxine glutinosa TaxID=7769 RepID=UPI00358F58DE
MQGTQTALLAAIGTFRAGRVGEMRTLVGPQGMLVALQLALAQVNKETRGDFGAHPSEVLLHWRWLVCERLGLPVSEEPATDKASRVAQAYRQLLLRGNLIDLLDVFMNEPEPEAARPNAQTLCSVDVAHFLCHSGTSLEGSNMKCSPPRTLLMSHPQDAPSSNLVTAARRVICAYIGLLVNMKDDLSLAVVLNVPERGLDCQAFTTLKHAAQNEDTSFFLAATSFVRRLELGGKIFAAHETDPLRKHVRGLTDLVHFLDRLADILGEAPSPREATERLLLAIKSQLLKSWSTNSALRGAIEEVSALLQARIFVLASEVAHNSTKGSPAQPKLRRINHGTAFAGRAARKLLLQLLDQEALFDSGHDGCGLGPLADLGLLPHLTLFRSPEQTAGSPLKPLRRRVMGSHQKADTAKVPRLQCRLPVSPVSQFSCTYLNDCSAPPISPVRRPMKSPPRPRCLALTTAASTVSTGFRSMSKVGEGRKRPHILEFDGGSNCKLNPDCVAATVVVGKENQQPRTKRPATGTGLSRGQKSCRARKAPVRHGLLPGQSKLTSYFTF